eukprot:CAMPEP_0179205848 /NCGR_PEP_ID=MMETSP0796-20121207/102625_1 /TAXON_ID=73915 /ORGANISM="Pyrodinium bahamense, Strain pbaha01" /LENGTH=381 /DNA_ID=CAMNT_0020910739 /DNA_START=84 /DNA_END=1226 /DNA_ORIENTATION=+
MIKSFNAQRGWGFIECEETQQIYGKDMFVMKSSLPGGFASKGDRVIFEVMQGTSGPEAKNVAFAQVGGASNGNGHAIGSKAWAVKNAPAIVANGRRSTTGFLGMVKSYNPTKGWGFVTSEALHDLYGKDIFFMKTALRRGLANPGDLVRFSIVQGARGPEATDLQPEGLVAAGAVVPTAAGGESSAQVGRHGPLPSGCDAGSSGSPQLLFGAVKSFNDDKGWGHITCELGMQLYAKDVFLMKSALGGQSVQAGSLVSFRVTMGAKGPQATDVQVLPEGCFSTDSSPGSSFVGVVKSFHSEKGWGFVTSDEIQQFFGKDIFLHRLELGGIVPQPGDAVQFTVEPGKTGQLEAKNVALSVSGEAAADSGTYRAVPRSQGRRAA